MRTLNIIACNSKKNDATQGTKHEEEKEES